ncbi:unnamed protein product [Adineta steineri]|uniref:G-protein coupled receptors family 1 profile domain-containing protein n=1 Tax=Adineta steineri TaxID=433720 RepID=A0A815MBF9_9BILA|nr:unnamed protein product [Adineta steineri]CAF1421076.1 unnamed protein product [Adineta steineri]
MASSLADSLTIIRKEIVIYFVIPCFILGVIGGCLNVIIFLNLKTFRQSSCSFYLMIMSLFDIGRFFVNVLPYIMRFGYGIDWGLSSLFFCKLRFGMFTTCTLSSMTCLCLAVMDQYFATSFHIRWQQWCNIKLAHRLTTIFVFIWILHGIPYIILYDHIISPLTNTIVCQSTNNILNQYTTYGYYIILTNLLPFITIVFGLMAYYNARHLAYRTVPLVRRELDKQLTVMTLVQVLISFCVFIPFSTLNIISIFNTQQSDPVFQAILSLIGTITTNCFILSFTTPFYTYSCVSKRFRRQLKHVLYDVHIKRCQKNKIEPIQIKTDGTTNS